MKRILTTIAAAALALTALAQAPDPAVRKVHIIFKTHLDIGFTDLSSKVEQKYIDEFIPKALAVADELRKSGAEERYVWTTGAWLVDAYLKQASPEAVKDLKEAIEKAPDQTITGKFVFASVGQTSLMMLYPEPIVYPELTYGGQTHKNITINFWGPSGGYFTNSSYIRVLELPVFMAYVYEGDKKLFSICDDVNNPSKAIYGQLFVTLSR